MQWYQAISQTLQIGCIAYAHTPDSQRKNLDDKSIKCGHLGVSEGSKVCK